MEVNECSSNERSSEWHFIVHKRKALNCCLVGRTIHIRNPLKVFLSYRSVNLFVLFYSLLSHIVHLLMCSRCREVQSIVIPPEKWFGEQNDLKAHFLSLNKFCRLYSKATLTLFQPALILQSPVFYELKVDVVGHDLQYCNKTSYSIPVNPSFLSSVARPLSVCNLNFFTWTSLARQCF